MQSKGTKSRIDNKNKPIPQPLRNKKTEISDKNPYVPHVYVKKRTAEYYPIIHTTEVRIAIFPGGMTRTQRCRKSPNMTKRFLKADGIFVRVVW